jgi:hypothetical protein
MQQGADSSQHGQLAVTGCPLQLHRPAAIRGMHACTHDQLTLNFSWHCCHAATHGPDMPACPLCLHCSR